jgi:LysM repeat protein
VTRYADYGTRRRPIRRDRVAIAIVVVAVVIVIPILIRSGCTGPSREPLVVTQEGTDHETTLPGVSSSGDSTASSTASSATSSQVPAVAANLTESVLTHVVREGETPAGIAAELGVTLASLRASSRLYGSETLQPGQVLVAAKNGVLHLIKRGQTLTDIAVTYAVPKETIAAANGISVNQTIFAGDRILIPTTTSTFWSNVVSLSNGVPSKFIWPLKGEVVSGFGWRDHPVLGTRHHHDGIDIDVPEGTMVYASASGRVIFYGEQPGYGNVLILEHEDGFYTMYGHLASSFVETGRFVEAGQGIAQSGNTGISSGPHLHFEIRNGEFPVDPMRYLP